MTISAKEDLGESGKYLLGKLLKKRIKNHDNPVTEKLEEIKEIKRILNNELKDEEKIQELLK